MSKINPTHRLRTFFKRFGKLIWTITYILFLIVFIGSIAVAYLAYPVFMDYQNTLPSLSIDKVYGRMKGNTMVYDRYDNPVNSLAEETFVSVTYDELPQSFIDAIVATEDSRFFTHNGVDGPRTVEAVVTNVLKGGVTSGGSTITQQLIKLTSLQEKIADPNTGAEYKGSNERKFHEIILAYQLEQQLSKEEILTAYANSIGYSRFLGVGTAAKRFFNKHVSQLTLPEAALLAGIPQSSTTNYPYRDMEAATERYQTVISLMKRHHYISDEEYTAIKNIPLADLLLRDDERDSFINKNQAYFDAIEAELNQIFNVGRLDAEVGEAFPYYYTGLKIYSALDVTQQNHANWIMNTEEVVPYSQMLWNLRGDSTGYENNLQAAFAVVDVHTGEIPAIGAARHYDGYNFALHGYRSPGSSIKPIIDYAPGMEKFGWAPSKTFKDQKTYYSGTRNEVFNFSNTVSNQNVTINQAIGESLNTIAVQAMQQVGVRYAGEFADSIGISRAGELLEQGELYESAALGGGLETTPVEMAGAYAAFANGGKYNPPHFIRRIENEHGEVIYEYKQDPVQMMSPTTARNITTSLIYARNNGTPSQGRRQVNSGITFAAKTGTSSYSESDRRAYGLNRNAEKDHWIAGYSPEYAIAVWTGFNIEDEGFLVQTGGNTNANKAYGSYIMAEWMNTFAPYYTDFDFSGPRNDAISIASLALRIDESDNVASWNVPKVSYPISMSQADRDYHGKLVFDVYVTNDGVEQVIIIGDPQLTSINYEQYLTGTENSIRIVARLEVTDENVHYSERQLTIR